MSRQRPGALFGLLLIFLMVACAPAATGDEPAPATDDPSGATESLPGASEPPGTEPPPAALVIDGREQEAGLTGYCWQQGDGTSICADSVGFTTAPDAIPAGSTFLAQFEFMLDARPGRVQLSIFPASQPILSGPEESDWLHWKSLPGRQLTLSPAKAPSIELTLPEGLYVLDLFVDWPDYGSVNYGFLVAVEGALSQGSTAFVDGQGLPLDEAAYRTRFEETVGEFQSLLMAALPGAYAGLWVEQQPEYRIVIALTEGDPGALQAYLDGYEWADLAEVLPVKHNLEELRADLAIASEAAVSAQVPAVAAVDIVNNRVVLRVDEPGLFLASLAQAGIDLPESVVVLAADSG